MYISTKTYGHEIGLSCAFRQWRAESHCKYLHGYALKIRFEFQAEDLDIRNWVVDFGGLKSLKGMLEDAFDHRTLAASDDPLLETFRNLQKLGLIQLHEVEATGCEAFARMIFDMTAQWLRDAGYAPRVTLRQVEVAEHGANSAIFTGE
jgi:6-pyruvoyltetrahydropterin/6-carboxytetrahydropterin synthase